MQEYIKEICVELRLKPGTFSSVLKFVAYSSLCTGERLFPPPSGLSYSIWFCVERFSTSPHTHPVRLLTVVRRATASEQHYVCLAIVLSAKDRSLIVSTKEELLQSYGKSIYCSRCLPVSWHVSVNIISFYIVLMFIYRIARLSSFL